LIQTGAAAMTAVMVADTVGASTTDYICLSWRERLNSPHLMLRRLVRRHICHKENEMNSREPPEEKSFGPREVISAWLLVLIVLTAINVLLTIA
jgi:hypothetical protein